MAITTGNREPEQRHGVGRMGHRTLARPVAVRTLYGTGISLSRLASATEPEPFHYKAFSLFLVLYFSSVTATQTIFQTITGQKEPPQLTIVASTLII
jgi:hypothetical protein